MGRDSVTITEIHGDSFSDPIMESYPEIFTEVIKIQLLEDEK